MSEFDFVDATVTAAVVTERGLIPFVAEVHYCKDEPYTLHFSDGTKEWVFARDLILEGLQNGQAGEGDVKAYTKEGFFFLEFIGDRKVLLVMNQADMELILTTTYACVPALQEDIADELDATLEKILES